MLGVARVEAKVGRETLYRAVARTGHIPLARGRAGQTVLGNDLIGRRRARISRGSNGTWRYRHSCGERRENHGNRQELSSEFARSPNAARRAPVVHLRKLPLRSAL